jgi:hypothetical protein
MISPKPQAKTTPKPTTTEPKEVKAPGMATQQVVIPGVTYSFNIVLDKAGSTAIAQFHLPLDMSAKEMVAYTGKALGVIELQQLKFDHAKLKIELKLSAAMLDGIKDEYAAKRLEAEASAKASGNAKLAKPVAQNLLAMDQNYKQAQRRHDAVIADLAQMEKRIGEVEG